MHHNQIYWIILIGFFVSFNTQAQTYFGQQNLISEDVEEHANDICAADINGDGNVDIVVAFSYEYKIAWYENTLGNGDFGDQKIISNYAGNITTVFTADIDGDGDIDVLASAGCHSEIIWYENTDGEGSFGNRQIITSDAQYASCVYAADIDADGDIDVISASRDDDKIAWYQNDGNGNFGAQLIISTTNDGGGSVYAADLDGDGDVDVLSGAYWGDKIAWYENIDGNGNFSEEKIISDLVDGVTSVFAIDLDGDVDMDVLSTSYNDNKIAWYENTDGNGSFGEQQIISTSSYGAADIYSADLDNDGDMDILSASIRMDSVVWYENMDGNGNFWKQQIISDLMDGPWSIYAADVDNDLDFDILATSYNDDKIAWHENFTLEILAQPQDQTTCPNTNTSFAILAKDANAYQWQVNMGDFFNNLIDNNTYSGVTTEVLHITDVSMAMSGFQYRCILSNPGGSLKTNEVTLMVEDFEIPVIVSSHPNQSLDANNNCEAILPDYTIDVVTHDNCDTNLDIVQIPNEGTSISGFTNAVNLIVTDDADNSISVSFNVKVLDNTSPKLVCADNRTIELEKGQSSYTAKEFEFDPVSMEDNCSIENISNNYNNLETLEGAILPVGTTTVSWTITDIANNMVECSHDITINPAGNIDIYPNPTNGTLYVESTNIDIQKIIIFDINGKIIFEKKATKQNERIDLHHLCSGIYVIRILTISEVFTSKIVKKT